MEFADLENFRAPTLFSWFISNFNTVFRDNISARLNNANLDAFLNNDDTLWD